MADIAELERRLVTLEQSLNLKRNLNHGIEDPTLPSVAGLMALNITQNDFNTSAVLTWQDIEDHPDVESYEIFQFFKGKPPKHLETVQAAPVPLTVQANEDGVVIVGVRAKFRGGVGNDYSDCPLTAIPVTKPSVTAASIADESIGDAKLDRTTDPIVVGTADIDNLAVTNAKIQDLAAGKITAGTFFAGVIYAGDIETNQILAGTVVGVNISAGTYSLISGNEQMLIDGTNGYRQFNSSTGKILQLINGRFISTNTSLASGILRTVIDSAEALFVVYDGPGAGDLADNFSISGSVTNWENPNGATAVYADGFGITGGQANSGRLQIANSFGTTRLQLGVDSAGNGQVQINGSKVLGVRQTDPGASPTTEQLRQVLIAHGLI